MRSLRRMRSPWLSAIIIAVVYFSYFCLSSFYFGTRKFEFVKAFVGAVVIAVLYFATKLWIEKRVHKAVNE